MIKLLNILSEIVVQKDPALKKITDYVRGGSKGDLDLEGTPIQSLPPGLKVEGNLSLYNCKNFKLLPDGLKVGGYLDLVNTPIQSLPPDLKVGGHLLLSHTLIQSLPPDLEVEGDLYLNGTPISKKYTEEKIRKMVPGVKGDIRL